MTKRIVAKSENTVKISQNDSYLFNIIIHTHLASKYQKNNEILKSPFYKTIYT
jgi:hypothetical protein